MDIYCSNFTQGYHNIILRSLNKYKAVVNINLLIFTRLIIQIR